MLLQETLFDAFDCVALQSYEHSQPPNNPVLSSTNTSVRHPQNQQQQIGNLQKKRKTSQNDQNGGNQDKQKKIVKVTRTYIKVEYQNQITSFSLPLPTTTEILVRDVFTISQLDYKFQISAKVTDNIPESALRLENSSTEIFLRKTTSYSNSSSEVSSSISEGSLIWNLTIPGDRITAVAGILSNSEPISGCCLLGSATGKLYLLNLATGKSCHDDGSGSCSHFVIGAAVSFIDVVEVSDSKSVLALAVTLEGEILVWTICNESQHSNISLLFNYRAHLRPILSALCQGESSKKIEIDKIAFTKDGEVAAYVRTSEAKVLRYHFSQISQLWKCL